MLARFGRCWRPNSKSCIASRDRLGERVCRTQDTAGQPRRSRWLSAPIRKISCSSRGGIFRRCRSHGLGLGRICLFAGPGFYVLGPSVWTRSPSYQTDVWQSIAPVSKVLQQQRHIRTIYSRTNSSSSPKLDPMRSVVFWGEYWHMVKLGGIWFVAN